VQRGAFASILLAGCASAGMIDDGSSVSFGPPHQGALHDPAALPIMGEGYWVPPTWAQRGLRYGTSELVAFVVYLGRVVGALDGKRLLAVADLSPERGGPSKWHRSHQTGRDVDLVFFARDAAGRPVIADAMRRFGPDGVSLPERGAPPAPPVYFDDAANWALVRAILENPVAEVAYIFVADDLKQRIIDTALAQRAPPELVAAAASLLQQPSGVLPHDDHMHVRLYCAPTDLPLGCQEIGSLRWYKKTYKYRGDQARRLAHASPVVEAVRSQQLVLTALPGLPFRGFVPR
jgi:penicillin-insensitive murein DD-endopeptidase